LAIVEQDHATGLLTHPLGELDAHPNERALADRILDTVTPDEVVVADRDVRFTQSLAGIADRRSYFVIRHHAP